MSYKYRVHDPRLGRFLSIDPLAAKYPHNSPYASSENRVIDAVELEGREVKLVTHYVNQDGSIGETYVQINHAQTVIRNGERMARTQVRTVGPGGRGFDEYTDIYEPAYVPGGVPQVHRLDPDAQIGIRGSLATGRKGPHKGNAPFDPNNFDVDAFIVSDKLAGQFSNKEWFRDGAKVGLSQLGTDLYNQLRSLPEFAGMRPESRGRITFRIYTTGEYIRKVQPSGSILLSD